METETSHLKMQLTEAYEQYADAIFRHCWFRVRDRAEAVDLMQETFVKTWRHLKEKGVKVENIRAFLYTVANHLIIDRSRKKRESSLDAMAEDGFNPGERDRNFEHDPITADHIHTVLAQINPKYREAVQLRFFDDLSPKEIAKILGISENNVSVRIHHGLRQLRQQFPPGSVY